MADFGGFQIQTPQEIVAQIQQQNQRRLIAAGQDPQSRRLATIQNNISGFAGQLRAMKQQEYVDAQMAAIKQASQALPSSASPQQRARARLEASSKVAQEFGDTNAVFEIDNQLLQLEEADFQRSRLMAREGREAAESEVRVTERKARIKELQRDMTRQEQLGNLRTVLFGDLDNPQNIAFDLDKPEGQQAYQEFLSDNPSAVPLSPEDAADILYGGSARSVVGKNEARALREQVDATARATRVGTRFLEVLRENPDAFTTGARVSGATTRFIRNLESMSTNFIQAAEARGNHNDNVSRINQAMDDNNITNTRLRGLAVNLAYALARQNDPGGRLSDNDIQFAMRMIGGTEGNPDPRAVALALKDNVFDSGQELVNRLERSGDSQFARDIPFLQSRLGEANRLIESFDTRLDPTPSTEQILQETERTQAREQSPSTSVFTTSTGAKVGR